MLRFFFLTHKLNARSKFVRMKTIIIFAITPFSFFNCTAQNFQWVPVGDGFDTDVRTLCADSATNLLYAGGSFSNSGTVHVQNIAAWDGTTWDSLDHGGDGNNVLTMQLYNNNLVVSGPFIQMGGDTMNYIAQWNGTSWNQFCDEGANETMYMLRTIVDTLYGVGVFDTICGVGIAGIAKYYNNLWIPYPPIPGINSEPSFFCINKYNDELYRRG